MSTYILFDKATGDILHIHREYYMDSDKTVELEEKDLLNEVGEMLPEGIDVGILAIDDYPQPVRGYRYYVDLTTSKLMRVEKPPVEKEQ